MDRWCSHSAWREARLKVALPHQLGHSPRLPCSHGASALVIASVGTPGSPATPAQIRLVSSRSGCSESQKTVRPGLV